MRRLLFITVIIVLSAGLSSAQDNSSGGGGTPPDLCQGVTCSPSSLTCPDGFVATCSNSCSNGACSACTPSCAGHDAPKNFCDTASCGSNEATCPDGYRSSCTKTCDRTSQSCITCEPSCEGHQAATNGSSGGSSGSGSNGTSGGGSTCPASPEKPNCGANSFAEPRYENGCLTRYECRSSCGTPPRPPTCEANAYPAPRYENGCLVSYECRATGASNFTCPSVPSAPTCESGIAEPRYEQGCLIRYECRTGDGKDGGHCPFVAAPPEPCPSGYPPRYENGCIVSYGACGAKPAESCGNGRCDQGETGSSCPNDCRIPASTVCPQNIQCSDGTLALCKQDGTRCSCDQCPIERIPQGCRQEQDDHGFLRVVCDERRECREASQEERIACVDKGGKPVFRKDPSGCRVFECSLGGEGGLFRPGPAFCPSEEENRRGTEKCGALGLRGSIRMENGCAIPVCVEERHEDACPRLTEKAYADVESQCDGPVAKFMNKDGCIELRCARADTCERDLPEEAYRTCGDRGGQLLVKRNENGCVAFSDCVRRGDVRESYIDEADELPEATELLSIAFKLEQLKVELDKLARETDHIADYYESVGSGEAERFARISDMFDAANEKIEGIKDKIRSRIDDLDRDDVREIRSDIRYIKSVVIKDIVYLMLSEGDDVKSIVARNETDCGDDEGCFDDAFRVCKPITFRPEGRTGPIVTLKGVEDGKCVMYAVMPEGEGPPAGAIPGVNPPYDMTCKIPNYALGMEDGPEKSVFPYCEGPMVKLIEMFGTDGGGKGGPGVPGKCSGDECREYCGRGAAEAKECLEHLGQYLPPEAKEGLTRLAQGQNFREDTFRQENRDAFDRREESRGFEPDEFNREEFRGDEFRSEPFRDDSRRGDFREEFGSSQRSQPREFQSTSQSRSEPAACVGCLNNNACDPGECSGCPDCL